MTSQTAQISNPKVTVRPSPNLRKYLSNIKVCDGIPTSVQQFIFKNPVRPDAVNTYKPEVPYLISSDDREFIKSLKLATSDDFLSKTLVESKIVDSNERLLSLSDLHWIYEYIQKVNEATDKKVYLHELLEGSEIILPKNDEIPRNEELELRCRKLKAQQQNREYVKMTKNVDSVKKHYPEDSLNYQMKQMNRSLVAIFQFIVSVAAGFVFGFIGIELLIGNLDFGFRLLLGIICALTIALAELYFLAKTLNEELQLDTDMQGSYKNFKLD